MKKVVLAVLAAGAILVAGDNTQLNESPMDMQDYKIYSGIMLTGNETHGRSSKEDFLGHSSGEFTNAGLSLVGGYKFTENENTNVNAEVRVGRSFFMEDSEDFTTTTVSVFVKPEFEVLRNISLYGLLGATYAKYSGRESVNGIGLAFGGGIEVRTGKRIVIFIDYVVNTVDIYLPYLKDDVNIDTLGAGIRYEF